jgi:regulator of RNase E activity RraA
MNVPVSLADVQVRPGDVVIGSDDGIVIVPKDREEEVLSVTESVSQAEDQILSEALKGNRLDEVRKKYKYHELQRR